MKRIFLLQILCIPLLIGMISGCNKPANEEQKKPEPLEVKIEVNDIVDNKATVTATLTSGQAKSGKIVTNAKMSSIDFDYEMEISLIKFIEKNGVEIQFPYTVTLENVIDDLDYLSGVLVYDETGRAATSAYTIWTGDGIPDGWSQNNDAGELAPNIW